MVAACKCTGPILDGARGWNSWKMGGFLPFAFRQRKQRKVGHCTIQLSWCNWPTKNMKKSAAEFLKYFSSTMDHPVSQQCRIYQVEDVCIHTGETPDELIEHLHGLVDHGGFPSDEEKERNIQYCFVHALFDSDLICKLLALKLTATTSEMLELCCTHITISDNMSAMGLTGSKTVNAIHQQKQQHQ